jgi:hypothetical protein
MSILPMRGSWRVGDVVRVGRPVLGNPADSLAVVVEVYRRSELRVGQGIGITLLFQTGTFDGFSPADVAVCGVERVAHNPRVAGYSWTSATRLLKDWTNGLFDGVWSDPTLRHADQDGSPVTLRPRQDDRPE